MRSGGEHRRGSRVADGVELVELDDPGRYNALTVAMVAELRDDVRRRCAPTATSARWSCTGRGKGFCAGANMTGDDVTPPEAQDRGPVGLDPLHPGQPGAADARDPRAAAAGDRGGARRRGRWRPRDRAVVRPARRQRRRVVRCAVHPGRPVGVRRREQLLAATHRRTDDRRRAHAHRSSVLGRRGAALRHAQPRRRRARRCSTPRSSSPG